MKKPARTKRSVATVAASAAKSKLMEVTAPDDIFSEWVPWLVTHHRRDVLTVLRQYKALTLGRRRELGTLAAYFVSTLEVELKKPTKITKSKVASSSSVVRGVKTRVARMVKTR